MQFQIETNKNKIVDLLIENLCFEMRIYVVN